jgi:hypothetical protein
MPLWGFLTFKKQTSYFVLLKSLYRVAQKRVGQLLHQSSATYPPCPKVHTYRRIEALASHALPAGHRCCSCRMDYCLIRGSLEKSQGDHNEPKRNPPRILYWCGYGETHHSPASRRLGYGFILSESPAFRGGIASAMKRHRPVLSITISGISEPVIRNSQKQNLF